MTGFGGVLALVLAETVAGGVTFTWLSPLWHETKRSYFTIYGVLMTLLFALPAWLAARAGALPGDQAALWGERLTLLTLLLVGGWTLLFLARQPAAGRVAGLLSVPASIAVLFAFAGTSRQAYVLALFQLLAGAAFLGAAYDGLFLGHWYLTDRKLGRAPINRYTTLLLVATVVELVAVASGGFSGTASSQAFNPLLTAGALAPWIAVGMTLTTLTIAALVKAALRGERASAVQSATGFYYLAVVTAFTAEVAVKTRFFPA